MDRHILTQKLIEWFDQLVLMKAIINEHVTYDIRNYKVANCKTIIFYPIYTWIREDDFSIDLYLKRETFEQCKPLIDKITNLDPNNYQFIMDRSPSRIKVIIGSIKYNEDNVNNLFDLLNKVIALED